MTAEPIASVDIFVGLQTPGTRACAPEWMRKVFTERFRAAEAPAETVEEYLAIMDDAGVERSLVFAPMAGRAGDPDSYRVDAGILAEAIGEAPERLSGVVGIDPTGGMSEVRRMEHAIDELGFVAALAFPHWFDLPPDHRLWYPFYAKCCELDVPILIQVGSFPRYSPTAPVYTVGRPITLDRPAIEFPELTIVGIHTGWPWTEELIAMAYKHENVYLGADAFSPKHWDASLVRFIDSWGSRKVLFGTDYPALDPRRARAEVEQLGLRPASLRRLLRDNAHEVFRL